MAGADQRVKVTLTVNGKRHETKAYPMARLLDVLREDLKLFGTKEGCGEGECGACSVMLNGRLVNSCLVPVLEVSQNAEITTIEGLAKDGELHPVQVAFLKSGGAQCGICTPGMVLATYDLLQRNASPTLTDVRTALAGNICRCTGYTKIFDAALSAAEAMREKR